MQEDHQQNQKLILERLVETLKVALSQLETVVHKDNSLDLEGARNGGEAPLRVRRFKYVFKKEKLEKAVNDLETWQRLFDPSWFLLMTIANPIVDKQLEEENREDSKVPAAKATALRSALNFPRRVGPGNQGMSAAPPTGIFRSEAGIDQSSPEVDSIQDTVRDLAWKFMNADPETFGLLHCKGVIKKRGRSSVTFFFILSIPTGLSDPCGLRSLLLDSNHYHSLSDRLQLAKDLARSVNYIHLFGYVHKNIRSENIIVMKDGKSDIGSAFLIGFKEVRLELAASRRIGDSILERDIYRHPDRQGFNPRESYIMQHDIYSLGVCLLEIGLWVSLPDHLTRTEINFSRAATEGGVVVKNHLLKETRESLPRRMGTKYAKVVETCLTCLDRDNEGFGDEAVLRDEEGVLVSLRYIEKVGFAPRFPRTCSS
ncbi:hypothetical protein ABW19_dt0201746 [Dactylella cylindrospora]|nr:hypothetical protein ABW19_dt0201746 [Dactylella cylindrospora]